MRRVSESWPALASRGATPGRAPTFRPRASGRVSRDVNPWRGCTYGVSVLPFCEPRKEDRDRSGVLTRTDLSLSIPRSRFLDPSAWRASGRGARCAPPIPPFRPGRLCLATPAVEPFGPSSPVRVVPGLPFVRLLPSGSRSGLRLRVQPSGSGGRKVRSVVPPWPAPRLAPPNRSLCGPPSRGLPALSSSTWRPWGYFVARLVGSHDEAPEASADEALQLPIGLPLLPGNFRPFASLKPPPRTKRHEACASWCRSRGSLRLREPLAGWSFMSSGSPQLALRSPQLQVAPATEPGSRVVTFRPSLWKCAHHANVTFALLKLRSEGCSSWTGGLGCDPWSQSLSAKQRIGRLQVVSREGQRTVSGRCWRASLNCLSLSNLTCVT